jgi:hypothetical protein
LKRTSLISGFLDAQFLPMLSHDFYQTGLVCREVAYQTVMGGINKELKAAQKKVWSTFPIQVGMFSLLDFGHSKVEVVALEDVKLVDIEFKRHDPHKIVENHLAQFNMKRYVHENSRMMKYSGELDYEEVQDRFQTLPQINKLVLSVFKDTGEITYQRYYKESR